MNWKIFFLALAIGSAAATCAKAEKRVALVIGTSVYQGAPQLPNVGSDVHDMASKLRERGFELVGGSEKLNPSKAEFDNAVQAFERSAADADVALFYFSGHGIEGTKGINYLAASDTNFSKDPDYQMENV